MKRLRAILVVAAPAALVAACASSGENVSSGQGTGAVAATGSSSASASSGAAGSSTSSASGSSSSSSSSSSGAPPGTIGPNGGTLDTLSFAVVGDTRPPMSGDVAGYPTAVITKIWQDVQAHSPRPPFAVTTGDYVYADPKTNESAAQLAVYITARNNFSNAVFPAMGNHECNGFTDSNCGQGNPDGITVNYTNFLSMLLEPLGKTLPYYTINVNSTKNAWTAKFVTVACNAWDAAQQTWLEGELAKPTTYTFVVRHEGNDSLTAPCLKATPSATTIMGQHPYTMLIAGHTHTFSYTPNEKQAIVGNGGAPLSGVLNYGYVIVTQQANGSLTLDEYDYMTNVAQYSFNVAP